MDLTFNRQIKTLVCINPNTDGTIYSVSNTYTRWGLISLSSLWTYRSINLVCFKLWLLKYSLSCLDMDKKYVWLFILMIRSTCISVFFLKIHTKPQSLDIKPKGEGEIIFDNTGCPPKLFPLCFLRFLRILSTLVINTIFILYAHSVLQGDHIGLISRLPF